MSHEHFVEVGIIFSKFWIKLKHIRLNTSSLIVKLWEKVSRNEDVKQVRRIHYNNDSIIIEVVLYDISYNGAR